MKLYEAADAANELHDFVASIYTLLNVSCTDELIHQFWMTCYYLFLTYIVIPAAVDAHAPYQVICEWLSHNATVQFHTPIQLCSKILENVAIANALQIEAARATPALFRFHYDTMPTDPLPYYSVFAADTLLNAVTFTFDLLTLNFYST